MCMVRQRSSRVCRSAQAYKKTWILKKKKNIMCCFPDNLQLRQG